MALPTSTQAVVEGIQLADLAGKHMTDTEVRGKAALQHHKIASPT